MSKVEAVCPHCKKSNTVEKSNHLNCYGLQNIQCTHCSKVWGENLGETGGLAKSAPAPSSELGQLRVQVRAQMDELLKKINGLIERRTAATTPARFNTSGVEKRDVAAQELEKALANGKPVTFQTESTAPDRFKTVESVGSGQRMRSGAAFDISGVEKSDVADQELRKALANGKPVGFIRSGT
jgi:phage FluMu protein Com